MFSTVTIGKQPVLSCCPFFPRLTAYFSPVSQELEKLISFSGTPTCVWRRTGEICLVGDEFCLLTEWSKDELLDPHGLSASEDTASSAEENTPIVGCRKKFIYEVSSHVSGGPNACLFGFNLSLRLRTHFLSLPRRHGSLALFDLLPFSPSVYTDR